MVRSTRGSRLAGTPEAEDGDEDSHTLTGGDQDSAREESTIRILIASDNHIGYAERDPIRGHDSYDSFREVLEIAKAEDVDMILLAGDLFHENKPSRQSMYQAMRSLRLNCLGDKPCELEVLGDQSVATEDTAVMHINYEDADINVAIPVFSIHGNHDDPSGEGRLCALDILQVAGLLNYYGRVPETDDITVKPVLLQKGTTKLALYGLSNVRDERLHRSFRHDKVKFLRPELYQDEWFNLIAVHQNHHGHSETNYLPENFLQNFFDFVVWGHEHECRIDPVLNPEQDFHVCQPGSSVATSLCAGEAVPKHVGVLSIRDREFKMRKIPLKSVRPFVMTELSLSDFDELDPKRKNKADVIALLMEKVEEAIVEARTQWTELQEDAEAETETEPPLPLIRLRVDYSSSTGTYELENPQRFSQRFLGRVANASDVVQFYTRKKAATRKTKGGAAAASDKPDLSDVRLENLKISALVRQYLATQSLQCLPENELGDAVTQYVDKDDKDAVKDFVNDHLVKQVSMMTANKTDENNINEAIKTSKNAMASQFEARQQRLEAQRRRKEETQVSDFESDGEAPRAASPPPVRRAPPPQKKAVRSPAAKRKTPAKRKQADSEEEEEEDVVDEDDVSDMDETENSASTRSKSTKSVRASTRKPASRQAKLDFSATPAPKATKLTQQRSIDISSDEEDDFQPPPAKRRR